MVSVIYMVLATGMFFFQDAYFEVGGMELSLKNPCALGILLLALLNLTATVRLDRLLVLSRHTAVQVLPCLIPLVFSAAVWVQAREETSAVLLGVTMVIPQLLSVLVAAATLYLFGSKGVWYCLGAMCAANLAGILLVVYEGGLGAFLEEFYIMLVTFTSETGPLMERLETHDLAFAFGPFLLYLLLYWKEHTRPALWLVLTLLFFTIGLKRIAVLAIVLGLLTAALIRLLSEKAARQTALCAAGAMMAASFLYIAGIRYGLFELLETQLGLDTKGRVLMFNNVKPYYDINIAFMGKGTGFERYVDWMTGIQSPAPLRPQSQIHNDFLRMYLNVGFFGYWAWIWSWLGVRLRYWFRCGGKDAGCLFLGICVYCFVLYATDNTVYYPYTMIACALVPMACRLEELAKDALEKRCSQWSESGGDGLGFRR